MPPYRRRQPRIRLRNLRPSTFVQTGTNQHVCLLQARLQQTVNRNARVPTIRRTDNGPGENFFERRNQACRIDTAKCGQITRGYVLPVPRQLAATCATPNTAIGKRRCNIA